MSLSEFLATRAQEYAPFDPARFPRIYAHFLEFFADNVPKIQIVGTNGKGSTGRFLTLLLEQAGFRVLHFTSPHLLTLNERFYKDRALVNDAKLEHAHARLQELHLDPKISFFEYMTLLAVILAQGCDYMITEAGLGGEWDSTTHLRARAALVITPISLDHTDRLGNTLEQIAHTKLATMGTLTPNTPVILAPQESKIAQQAHHMAQEYGLALFSVSPPQERAMIYASQHYYPPFLAQNFQTALTALGALQIPQPSTNPSPLNLRGRFERLEEHLIIDVAHNVSGAQALKEALQENFGDQKIHLVYHSYSRKDVRGVLACLKPIIARVWVLEFEDPQLIDMQELALVLEDVGVAWARFNWEAFKALRALWVVGGSFSVVRAFLKGYHAR
ncbi:bifunctional folylpolyglutamate synthase/dihydrofolate synthase [Helicobacter baculiformis]|uniref:Dihydrofolate synthase/folylpolyglutamate synthase n=1 Tax=Helicobacter baculiformis TaxID=427351 RepID=A0ABV7ZHI2_9HELI|nr:Mur ligase family protein [Helicobacter baculiformis]